MKTPHGDDEPLCLTRKCTGGASGCSAPSSSGGRIARLGPFKDGSDYRDGYSQRVRSSQRSRRTGTSIRDAATRSRCARTEGAAGWPVGCPLQSMRLGYTISISP
jgi:hypothetical protein